MYSSRKKESKKNDLLSNKKKHQTFSYTREKSNEKKCFNSQMLWFVREKMVKNSVIDILLRVYRVANNAFFFGWPFPATFRCIHAFHHDQFARAKKIG